MRARLPPLRGARGQCASDSGTDAHARHPPLRVRAVIAAFERGGFYVHDLKRGHHLLHASRPRARLLVLCTAAIYASARSAAASRTPALWWTISSIYFDSPRSSSFSRKKIATARATANVLIDDERVRVTQWRFAPGAATGWHRHVMDYVVVPMADGDVELHGSMANSTCTESPPRYSPGTRSTGLCAPGLTQVDLHHHDLSSIEAAS